MHAYDIDAEANTFASPKRGTMFGTALVIVDQAASIGALPWTVARDAGCHVAHPGLAMRRVAIHGLLTQFHPGLERAPGLRLDHVLCRAQQRLDGTDHWDACFPNDCCNSSHPLEHPIEWIPGGFELISPITASISA